MNRPAKPSLLIATNNPGKIKELQELLADVDIELVTPAQIDLDLDVVEDGKTYTENASKKAVAFAQASGRISLADDSGLEVEALGGEPGLYSARYGSAGGQKLSDAERRRYLLNQLQSRPRPWKARFHATIAIATPGTYDSAVAIRSRDPFTATNEHVYLTEGFCEGEIIPEERGSGGFGYDPIFFLPELGKTMAELPMDEKNRLSHRARAVMKAKSILNTLIDEFL